jgi:hypothetical protein
MMGALNISNPMTSIFESMVASSEEERALGPHPKEM